MLARPHVPLITPDLTRVKRLAVLVGNLPGSPTAVVQPSWVKIFNRQLPLWLLRTFAPSMMARLVAGLPKGFAMSREDARFVSEFIDSLFPVSPEGVDFDAFVEAVRSLGVYWLVVNERPPMQ